MFKLHKPQSIHSGHFMVSRLDDDDEDDNNDPADDSSESERDNSNNVEIDVNNPESVVDADNLNIKYQVESPSAKDEHLTSWNDLDRPAKHSQKHHQYLTYYTNSYNEENNTQNSTKATRNNKIVSVDSGVDISCSTSSLSQLTSSVVCSSIGGSSNGIGSVTRASTNASSSIHNHHSSVDMVIGSSNATGLIISSLDANKESLGKGINSHLNHLHQHHHLQDQQLMLNQDQTNKLNHAHQQRNHNINISSSGCSTSNNNNSSISSNHNYQHQHHHHHHHHHQHAVTIDTSLTKLLECMSLYYSSKLTSPKWKSFKGLKLRLKYKIRLNNLIWRAWFLQCIRGRRPPGCQFTAPIETDVHKKSETIVLEGKYWKRKEKAIVDEYKKWRTFHKQKSQMNCFRPSSFDWDSRVSNLASSSMYPEYHFYPDYDMNITYNLDDLPPMLEDIETREADFYYPSQSSVRMVEQQQQQNHHHHQPPPPPQQQQQQQQQQHPSHPQLQTQPTHHQLQSQQQQQHLAQLQQVTTNNNSQQAVSLKREQASVIVTSNSQQHQHFHPIFTHSHQQQLQHHQQQQQQQHQQQHAQPSLQQQSQQRPPVLSFNFDNNPFYQQINEQLQQQQVAHVPHSISSQQQQHQHQQQQQQQQQQSQPQQQQQQNVPMSITPELYPLVGNGSGRNEQRRVCHINAEQKRRCNIKNGFDTLKSILPSINPSVNVKISKASMLQKAAVYISTLSAEQKQQADEQAMLKQQIEGLKQTISAYQCQLPASGGPVGCQGSSQAREMLQDYVRRRTLENWKFWIFSLLIEPLFETYYNSVNTNTLEDSCKTIFTWLDRNCGLVSLRKDVLESLTFLSTSTNILNTPQTLPTEAVDAVRYQMVPTTSGPPSSSRQHHPQLTPQHPSQQHQQPQPPPPPPPQQHHHHHHHQQQQQHQQQQHHQQQHQQQGPSYTRVNLM